MPSGIRASPCGGHHHLFGEGAEHPGPGHPVTDGEIGCPVGDFDDNPGELAAGHERRGHADLVVVGDQQNVGIVHRRGADPHPDLAGFERRRRPLFDADDFRRPVLRADRGAHVVTV